jgi:Malonate decarboxylase gamma subunit (MdcE)
MDLPSMSRVTKLPLDTLTQLAKTTLAAVDAGLNDER